MKRSDNRLRTVAALAVSRGTWRHTSLADYASGQEVDEIGRLILAYTEDEECTSKMDTLLNQMLASEKFTSLVEVHPAWISERLKDETPRVIGIILRSLSSRHVRYIIDHLSPVIRAQIPNLVESFAVPAPVLKVILDRFESHFLPMRTPRTVLNPGFENLYYLKGNELLEVIREAGLNELAVAFGGMPPKALHVIYNRLALKDAKRLQKRVRSLEAVDPELVRSARHNVLAVEEGRIGADRMLVNMGLASLGCSLWVDSWLADLIIQKMEPSMGYLLKRSIDECRFRTCESLVNMRRSSVIDIVIQLADEEKIDPSWKDFFKSEDDHIPLKGGGSSSMTEDETATAQLLA